MCVCVSVCVSKAVGGGGGDNRGSEAPAPHTLLFRIPYPYLSTPALVRLAPSPVNKETLHLAAQSLAVAFLVSFVFSLASFS